ncbi:MAG: V-type ATP synthase subunit I [Halapricum sp.]
MLRPERMSRVSVTGSKRVMDDVIESMHRLDLMHLSDYTNTIEGFEPGSPIEGADEASNKLVTVRSLKSILGVDESYEGPTQVVEDEDLETELEDVRQEVNELDDRRDDLEDELQSVEDDIERLELFVDLGIDLDLLRGYDSLEVAVGEGDPEEVEAGLAHSDIEEYDVASGGDAIAVFARVDDPDALEEVLVSATFAEVSIPDGSGDPAEFLQDRKHRKQQLESKLSTAEDELDDLRLEVGGFLLAAEETLAIDVQKREAPLSFATTDSAFVAEGWLPTDEIATLESAVSKAAGDSVEIEEIERADYTSDGELQNHETVTDSSSPKDEVAGEGTDKEAAADDEPEKRAATDGGSAVVPLGSDRPPVIQDNPGAISPFETLVEVINRPKYTEFDPTLFVFLTFPLFFGLMIGDVGYGAAYAVVGYALYTRSDSDALSSLGAIAVWAGVFSAFFGLLAGEIFGFETITHVLWDPTIGHPIIRKGVRGTTAEITNWAKLWLTMSVLLGLVHLTIGYVLDFFKKLPHGLGHAVTESGSWILMTLGIWVWIFSRHGQGLKPEFLYYVFNGEPLPLGFGGFPPIVGLIGLVGLPLGAVLLYLGEPIELVEILNTVVNVLSYTRLAAEVLAEAGIAFVVNLLFFGAYNEAGEFHLLISESPHHIKTATEATVMFPGLVHMGILGILLGIVVLVFGHLLVIAIGVLSAGMQAVRLEYVEFFSKFYDGGGRRFTPFGYERKYTTDD